MLDGFSNGEGENPLLFSLTARNAAGPLPSRPHLRGSRFSRLPPLCLPPTRRLFQNDESQIQAPWRPPPSTGLTQGPEAHPQGWRPALEALVLEAPSPRPQAWHLGRHFLRRSASIQNTAVITAQAPARIRPGPGPPFFATIRVHPKYGRHNCAGACTDTPGIWTGKNIHNPTATKNYVSTKLPRLESATPTATRQYVFADEVPHPHGTDIASTAYDDRRDLAADPFLRRLCDRTPFTCVGPAVRTIRVQVRPP